MDIHIFTNEGGYNRSFLEFFERNFDVQNSLIVFRSRSERKYSYSPAMSERVIYAENFISFLKLLTIRLLRAERIFMHYYSVGPSLYFWYIFRFLLKKTTWILWGGDLYYFKDKPDSLLADIYEYIRRSTIKKFGRIACFIEGDYLIARDVYKTRAPYEYVCYPIPVDFRFLDKIRNLSDQKSDRQEGKTRTILVGNSASPTNNHLEILQMLSVFVHEDIKIICPLSYPDEKQYTERVIQYGKNTFGSKFIPLRELMNTDEYGRLLSGVDVAIMNHERQQGLGNVLSLLYLGKKVYLRKEVTSYIYFKNKDVKIFETGLLGQENFEELFYFNESEKQYNYSFINSEFSEDNYKKMWSEVLYK